jgi:hypothetical protein
MIELASNLSLASAPAILAADAAIPAAVAAPELAWAGLILLLPALAAILCGVCAAMKIRGKLPGIITVIALLGAFATTFMLYRACPTDAARTIHLFDWVAFGWGGDAQARWHSFLAPFALYVDSLTLLWMLFVTGLGSLIAIYATEYMEADVGKGYARFFGSVSIFLFAMGALVMGGNLILLYLGWEGVGLASYLLIGYYYHQAQRRRRRKEGVHRQPHRRPRPRPRRVPHLVELRLGVLRRAVPGAGVGRRDLGRRERLVEGGHPLLPHARRIRQERAGSALRVAARRHGRSDPRVGAHPRRDHGHGRHLPHRSPVPVL